MAPEEMGDAALAFDVANLRKRLAASWADGLCADEVGGMCRRLEQLVREQRRRRSTCSRPRASVA